MNAASRAKAKARAWVVTLGMLPPVAREATRSHFGIGFTSTALIGAMLPPAGYAYDEKLSSPHTQRPNGALLSAPPALWDALLERDWRRLFVELRPLWHQAQLVVFGHALLEKLASPRKDLTAHVWCADAPLAFTDDWLAGELTAQRLAAKPFTPLPVLGVPGWWAENVNFSFYDDSLVFRPRKTPEPTTTTTSAGLSRS